MTLVVLCPHVESIMEVQVTPTPTQIQTGDAQSLQSSNSNMGLVPIIGISAGSFSLLMITTFIVISIVILLLHRKKGKCESLVMHT